MFKRDPDDLISAVSKNFKNQNTQIMRITLKRGGDHFRQIAKAHSRAAKKSLSQRVKTYSNQHQGQIWPLYVRYKQNALPKKQEKQQQNQPVRLNASVKLNKGYDFISSLLGVFRVNFFKKKQQKNAIQKAGQTKKNPNSHRSLKKIAKNKRNKQRRDKRQELVRQKKREKTRGEQQTPKQTLQKITESAHE